MKQLLELPLLISIIVAVRWNKKQSPAFIYIISSVYFDVLHRRNLATLGTKV